MGQTTAIAWTDATQNFWQGCKKVSTGCKFCYMYRDKERYKADPTLVVRSADATFYAPLRKRSFQEPQRVFTCSWSDFFIEEADAWRPDAWYVMKRSPHLITYQILTKRPGLTDRHGTNPAEWPTHLRVQQFPDERPP